MWTPLFDCALKIPKAQLKKNARSQTWTLDEKYGPSAFWRAAEASPECGRGAPENEAASEILEWKILRVTKTQQADVTNKVTHRIFCAHL